MAEILELALRDPHRGARLTPFLVGRLRERLAAAPSARIVVMEGGEGSFCEGLDLRSIGGEILAGDALSAGRILDAFGSLLSELRGAPRPVVAVVDGPAMGGGVGLAAAADVVLASARATFSLPETLFGLIPAVIFPYLSQRVGVGRARSMAIAGETLTAEQAERWGLVDRVCDDLAKERARLERRLLRQDAAAHAAVKGLINEQYDHPPGYRAVATSAFASLLESESTRTRLARHAAGKYPWPEQEEGER